MTLSGRYNPTHGHAAVVGLDLEEDVEKIRRLTGGFLPFDWLIDYLGMCPQKNLFWMELTGNMGGGSDYL